VATINQSGIALLSQEGEKFVAVYRDADGQVVLQPIKVPPGTLFVREIERPAAGGGAPRIALKQLGLAKGNYRMKWMDLDGVAILEKE
jgi:hypothetical protein